ncbi:MAG: hypothetical protein GC203_03995 [Phenylobacterium sp.]|uniref:F0F1 ATP synthase subunit delta n=1 Tax=Phenylobacterium sp. TaxID=1871053 RepID=UPI0025D2A93B|nr:F0F1 ATP synthase subunit delta [Phenylobacterium sp.]MBI1197003.1 hypothetical protein [Phenylobacterium sp.]
MQIDFWTLGLQAANFLILVWLLHRFLYKPVLAAIAARQAEADRLTADGAQARAAVEAERSQLEAERAALAKSRDEVLAQARSAAEAERKSLLEKAGHDAEALTAEARKALAREQAEAARTVGRRAATLGGAIARKLLDRDLAEAVQDHLVDQLCADLEALPAETRTQIAGRLGEPGAVFEVASAAPLSAARTRRLRERLEQVLGVPAAPVFRVDPGLIAGAEVRFPFTVLRRTWSEDLDRIEAELVRDDA